jgi:hypothetical protein
MQVDPPMSVCLSTSNDKGKAARPLHHACAVRSLKFGSALCYAHASPRLTPVLGRIMNPPKADRQFRDKAERLMTGL